MSRALERDGALVSQGQKEVLLVTCKHARLTKRDHHHAQESLGGRERQSDPGTRRGCESGDVGRQCLKLALRPDQERCTLTNKPIDGGERRHTHPRKALHECIGVAHGANHGQRLAVVGNLGDGTSSCTQGVERGAHDALEHLRAIECRRQRCRHALQRKREAGRTRQFRHAVGAILKCCEGAIGRRCGRVGHCVPESSVKAMRPKLAYGPRVNNWGKP